MMLQYTCTIIWSKCGGTRIDVSPWVLSSYYCIIVNMSIVYFHFRDTPYCWLLVVEDAWGQLKQPTTSNESQEPSSVNVTSATTTSSIYN